MDLDAIDIQTLIIADILGSITPEEKDQLNKLLAESETVRLQYENIQKELASEGTQIAGEGYATADQLIAIAGKRKRGRIIRLFAAASAVLILGGGLLYYISAYMRYADERDNMAMLITPSGKDSTLILSDGSTVILNAASKLEFQKEFHGDTREVTLTGEAYFKVAKNTKPFIVHTSSSEIRVLGTEFNVNSYDNNIVKVALVEGSVKMNAGGNSVLLVPGKAAIYAGKGIEVNSFEKNDVLDWQKGILHFPGEVTVDQVAKAVSRYSGIKLIVDQSATGKKFIGIVYERNKPIEKFLPQLEDTKTVIAYKEGEAIHLK